MELLHDFLGRAPKMDAFLEECGLVSCVKEKEEAVSVSSQSAASQSAASMSHAASTSSSVSVLLSGASVFTLNKRSEEGDAVVESLRFQK